jgi:hypothetical protein
VPPPWRGCVRFRKCPLAPCALVIATQPCRFADKRLPYSFSTALFLFGEFFAFSYVLIQVFEGPTKSGPSF